jgi:glycosyl transferase family 25
LEFEPSAISQEIDRKFFSPSADLTVPEKSCALKHIVAMQRIVERKQEMAFIIEDDAQLRSDFHAKLQVILKDAERWPRPRILHLGAASNFYTPASQLIPGQHVFEGSRVRNMEMYALGATEAQARLDWIARHRLSLPIDIAFNKADPEMGIPFLWSEPPLAEQGSLNGKFASSLSRKNRSQFRLKIQFAYQRFCRAKIKRWFGYMRSSH